MDYIKSTMKILGFGIAIIALTFLFPSVSKAQNINPSPWRETFELYGTTGNLNNIGLWRHFFGVQYDAFQIINSPINNIKGSYGLEISDPGTNTEYVFATSTLDVASYGVVYGSVKFKHEGSGAVSNYPNGIVLLDVRDTGERDLCFFMFVNGTNDLYARSSFGEVYLGRVATSTWENIEMEYNFTNAQCRARILGDDWSEYFDMDAGFDGTAVSLGFGMHSITGTKKVYVDDVIFRTTEQGGEITTIDWLFPQGGETFVNDFSHFQVDVDFGDYPSSTLWAIVQYEDAIGQEPVRQTQATIPRMAKNFTTTYVLPKVNVATSGVWNASLWLQDASGTILSSGGNIEYTFALTSTSTVINTAVSGQGILPDDFTPLFPDTTTGSGSCSPVYTCTAGLGSDFWDGLACNIGYGLQQGISFAFCPSNLTTTILEQSLQQFQTVPPFDVFFTINDEVYNSIGSTATTSVNAVTLTLASSSLLGSIQIPLIFEGQFEEQVGTTTKDTVLWIETMVIWLAAGYGAVRMILSG